jgi:hypothetical protein
MTRPRTVIRPIFLFEHGPFGKPVPIFPGHALEAFHIAAVRGPAQTRFHSGRESGGRLFRTCTTRKLDEAAISMTAFFKRHSK